MSVSWGGLAGAVDPGTSSTSPTGRSACASRRSAKGRRDRPPSRSAARSLHGRGSTSRAPPAASAVPEEDLEMLRFGESIGVDLVALSFVRTAEDVENVRKHTRLPLIAKIEKPQAVDAAEDIIRAADCVMVARGDLGSNCRSRTSRSSRSACSGSPASSLARRSPRPRCSTRWSPPVARPAPRRPTSRTRSSTAPTRSCSRRRRRSASTRSKRSR